MTFKDCNPLAVFLYFAGILLISMFIPHPLILFISFLGASGFCVLLISAKQFFKEIRLCLVLTFLITVLNPFISHNGVTTLFYFNDNPVTLEAYLYGAGIGLMVSTVFLWCKALGTVFTVERTVYLFGKAAPKIAIVLTVALRYIPLLRKQSKKISEAQKLIGLRSSDGYYDRIKAHLQMFSSLIGWSIENAVETANAMRAKGYGAGKRTAYSDFSFRPFDALLVLFTVAFSIVVFISSFRQTIDFSYYPEIKMNEFSVLGIAAVMAFTALAFLPLILEVKERVKWKRLKLKI
ncbi:MAG TPA: hypothetical protein DEW35_00025 [Ruminococcaceae bacterium]|nr:hypothetical protein [Oscillospiraceae bacterium]